MTLHDYLRAQPPSRPRWRAEARHAEGGAWAPLGEADELGLARENAQAPLSPRARGDLLRVVDRDGRVGAFGVVARSGAWWAPPVEQPETGREADYDWERVWEGPEASGSDLLLRAGGAVDRRRLVAAAFDAVGHVRHRVRRAEPRPAAAAEAARAWAYGEGSLDALRAAAAGASAALGSLRTNDPPEVPAAQACHHLALAASSPTLAAVAATTAASSDAAASAAGSQPGLTESYRQSALRRFAVDVRTLIPLSELLLSMAGEPTPLALGL